MFDKQLIATPSESLAEVEPTPALTDAERALQLYEAHEGYAQWKVIFPGTVVMSERVAAMYGLAAEGPVPLQEMVKLYLAEDRGKLLALIAQALQDRRGFRCRLRVERRDGGLRMIESIADLRVRDGRVIELFGMSRDVTAEMERELQVQGRLKLVQDLVGDMPAPIAVLDDKLRVLDCSLYWLKAHRFVERREVIGKTIAQLFPETPAEQIAEYEAALRGQTVKTRRTFASPTSGAATQFAAVLTPWYVAERKVGGVTLVVGWSEIATTKRSAPVAAPVEDFDGSLLDMLKNVS
ncbi:MAG TPA: PAS domain-containing protein [Devosia sp.]|jgi:PAS domain-containing protein|uniref:PAS domain-containing protein n=1 Tax=Devosia sp. TaxID=1871048 RepID=UPI002DDDABEC|nr:PAS domain-containing protein [Devosia sp.]HEV2516340.1 PAS domain-containing protein [Devosia sp.]